MDILLLGPVLRISSLKIDMKRNTGLREEAKNSDPKISGNFQKATEVSTSGGGVVFLNLIENREREPKRERVR